MSVKILEKKDDKICLEIGVNDTIKDILSVLEFNNLNDKLKTNGLDDTAINDISNEINKNWWDNNKTWFLAD
ncbi:MAG: hypothetical protein KA885_06585 [Spirochaetes bacterium]|nr:hypothetical protein [Spirochaetota bacterium]